MHRSRLLAFVAAAVSLSCLALPYAQNAGGKTCLAFITYELAKGDGNFFSYYRISDKKIAIRDGDTFVYSIYLDPKNPLPKGGVDIDFQDGGVPLRDMGLSDQDGNRVHGDGNLEKAKGKWYTRHIPLSDAKGRTTKWFNIQSEGDSYGRYIQFLSDIYIQHADGTKDVIYDGGKPTHSEAVSVNGYSGAPACIAVDKDQIADGKDIEPFIAETNARVLKLQKLDEARKDLEVTKAFLKRTPDPAIQKHVDEAMALLDAAIAKNASPEEIQVVLHAAKHALSHTHPVMTQYTGHLVGHAHIDLQWLWEWQEGMVATRDTFNQAVKFMDEFPGFTFSQSSSCLYQTVEESYPEIFKKIQQKVKKGQWELVGGRVCEGDTNMISAESNARQFLYGQRYFREKFGKTAKVGWEPDTFGHNAQMPQILKLGGCDSYYFCRGGKGKPLFWWQALDGTKVLAFDEPASGSWYNSDLSYKQFQEVLDFQTNTGSKDMLWVYGVGNHGGGPTREHIEEALRWMKTPGKPKVLFSTATQFFDKLKSYDLTKIPVIDKELNPVFEGCYTSHSEIKQLNRLAEYSTTSAEAVSTVASFFGFKYPRAEFRKNWEDICFNHHHDTLPGSGIHAPYDRTQTDLKRVLADNKAIVTRALETLSVRVTPEKGAITMMVFNPSGWKRSGWVETYLVASGWSQINVDMDKAVAVAPDGKSYPVEVVDRVSRRVRFYAPELPAYGYRVFNLKNGSTTAIPAVAVKSSLENEFLRVEFDVENGTIKRIFDKAAGREVVSSSGSFGRLEEHYEEPNGMSAWVIGPIKSVKNMKCVGQKGPGEFLYSTPAHHNPGKETTVVQRFKLAPGSRQVEVEVDCDWQHIGTDNEAMPFLKVAFDTAVANPTATYEIPFGAVTRPADGKEWPALNWADLSANDYGVSILNDAKSGHSANGSSLRLSLIRASYSPDPNPNPGRHVWHYAIYPHSGGWQSAETVKKGLEFQTPLMPVAVPFDAQGSAPQEFSLLGLNNPNVVATGLKLGEDSGNLILRMYESSGRKADLKLDTRFDSTGASWVNFIEDSLGVAPLSKQLLPISLRPFEIRTVKFKLAPFHVKY